MDRQSNKITALYCRVDGGKYRPDAISAAQTQQVILIRYAKEHGLENLHIFSDCGFSGANLNRPAFQRMLREIKAGNVAALVVKDMGRLARNSLDVGVLLEKTLPQYGVVFHALDGPYIPVLPLYEAVIVERGRT